MSKRIGGLMLAVVLATLATAALISYVHALENRAFSGVQTVEIYVARDAIPAGMSAETAVQRALIAPTAIPRKVMADGAVASLEEIRGKVAAVTILKGEQIVSGRFVSPATAGGGLEIPAGRQAMAVAVEGPPGVAGFVQPGAHVSILAHLDVPAGTKGAGVARAQFLLQDVSVLAVGQRATTTDTGSRSVARQSRTTDDRVLLTLAVSPAQAEKLAFALFEGDVYFTLLPPDQAPTKTPGRTGANVFR